MSGAARNKDANSRNSLYGKDLLDIRDLDKDQIKFLMRRADTMLEALNSRTRLDPLKNMILGKLFFEESTRTRQSFEIAIQKLGGGYTGFNSDKETSVMKGESLADTVKVMSLMYADVLVLRHPYAGAGREAAKHSDVPVINAGDGVGQHPTQALLDMFTLRKEKGKMKDLNIAIVGDLANGRTVHSLAYALAVFNNNITFIAPPELQLPRRILSDLKNNYSISVQKTSSIEAALDVDVIYMTRIQRERFEKPEDYAHFATSYTIDEDFMSKAKSGTIVMHPGSRLTEISPKIDSLPGSVYFRQASYGVPTRMAILESLLVK